MLNYLIIVKNQLFVFTRQQKKLTCDLTMTENNE